MKIFLLLALLCEAVLGGPASVRVTFSPLTKVAYLQAKKSQIVTKPRVTFSIKKQRGRIVIPTAGGQKIYQDKGVGTDDDDQQQFEYSGYLPQFGCHLIVAHYWERTQWLLLDAKGHQIDLWGEPVFSPDLKHLAATCPGIEYGGGQPNIIQLVELRKGSLRETWSLEPKTWEPYQICWTAANELLLSKEMWTGKNPGNTFTYAKLTIY